MAALFVGAADFAPGLGNGPGRIAECVDDGVLGCVRRGIFDGRVRSHRRVGRSVDGHRAVWRCGVGGWQRCVGSAVGLGMGQRALGVWSEGRRTVAIGNAATGSRASERNADTDNCVEKLGWHKKNL